MIEDLVMTAVAGITIFLAVQFFSNKSTIFTLKKENAEIGKKYRDSQKVILALEAKVLAYEDKKAILSKYEWNNILGTWRNKHNGLLYCNKCLNKIPPIEVPLKKCAGYFSCTNCDEQYSRDKNIKSPLNDFFTDKEETKD